MDNRNKKMVSGKNNLHKAEKPWKPSFITKPLYGTNKTVIMEEKIKRNTLCILNKLTPEKFEILFRQFIQLEFDTKEKLDLVIDLIFEKAIFEPLYSIIYANLCKHLCMNKVTIKTGEHVDIHHLLVSKCQKELQDQECDKLKELKNCEILEDIDCMKNTKLYEEEKKIRVCRIGKMKFIGELFNVDLNIKCLVQDSIQNLLAQDDESSLECLCQLLTTTGKKLDDKLSKDKESIDKCFEQLQKIVDEHLHSKRIRFLLQDVLDLRKNNWTPRRAQNNPKTIKQIHREVVQEALEREKGLNGYKQLKGKEIGLRGSELSPEEVKLKSKHLIEEFLNNNNFEFIIRYIKDLFTPTTVNIFIKIAIHEALERSSQARNSIGQLLVQLLEKDIITIENYKNGFDSIFNFGDETKEDIPMISIYTFEILKPIISDNRFSLNLLKDIILPCIPSKISGEILSSVLLHFAEKKGKFKASKLWIDSNLDWSDFLGKDTDVLEFIHTNKLEFMTVYPLKNLSSSTSTDELKQHLLRLLKSEDIKDISDWLDDFILEKSNPSFIRTLTSAVVENAVQGSSPDYKLNGEELLKTVSIISTFINGNKNLELQVLYSIQSLVHHLNHPKDLLLQIFCKLCEEDVISTKTFEDWKESQDAEEREGKKEALESVKQFFVALENADFDEFLTDETEFSDNDSIPD